LAAVPDERVDELVGLRAKRALKSVPAISRDAYTRALAGEVVTGLEAVAGHKAQVAWGVSVVSQPIDRYWAAVNDDRNKVEYTKLTHVELLNGDYCAPKRTVFQYMDVSVVTDRWWVVDITHNETIRAASAGRVREMTWKSVAEPEGKLNESAKTWAAQGVSVAFTEGSWTLVDLGDGRTLVEYYAWSDPGGSVPAKMASSFAVGGITDAIQNMARLAAKGPSCK
jgi:hypothetical protein